MAVIKITVRKNGPYRVEGDLSQLQLTDFEGNPYDLTGKPGIDRKSTRLNSSHIQKSRMPSSA